MSDPSAGKNPKGPKAQHGTPSEVSWGDGKGRQPYANRGPVEGEPSAAPEAESGDRGELSGRNLEQLEQVRKKP